MLPFLLGLRSAFGGFCRIGGDVYDIDVVSVDARSLRSFFANDLCGRLGLGLMLVTVFVFVLVLLFRSGFGEIAAFFNCGAELGGYLRVVLRYFTTEVRINTFQSAVQVHRPAERLRELYLVSESRQLSGRRMEVLSERIVEQRTLLLGHRIVSLLPVLFLVSLTLLLILRLLLLFRALRKMILNGPCHILYALAYSIDGV